MGLCFPFQKKKKQTDKTTLFSKSSKGNSSNIIKKTFVFLELKGTHFVSIFFFQPTTSELTTKNSLLFDWTSKHTKFYPFLKNINVWPTVWLFETLNIVYLLRTCIEYWTLYVNVSFYYSEKWDWAPKFLKQPIFQKILWHSKHIWFWYVFCSQCHFWNDDKNLGLSKISGRRTLKAMPEQIRWKENIVTCLARVFQ